VNLKKNFRKCYLLKNGLKLILSDLNFFFALLVSERVNGLCWCCAKQSRISGTSCEQAITNKRIEETLIQAFGEANTRAMLHSKIKTK
jgi:hypothetical protein